MEKKIMYTEYEPDKQFMWLHTKNSNLVLEVFGNSGWESVGDDSAKNDIIRELSYKLKDSSVVGKNKPIKVEFPKLDKSCSKESLISTVEKLKGVLVKSGIIEIK